MLLRHAITSRRSLFSSVHDVKVQKSGFGFEEGGSPFTLSPDGRSGTADSGAPRSGTPKTSHRPIHSPNHYEARVHTPVKVDKRLTEVHVSNLYEIVYEHMSVLYTSYYYQWIAFCLPN